MKILSRMLSKKIEPKDAMRDLDFENRLGQLSPRADDTGTVNKSTSGAAPEARDDLRPRGEEPDVAASGWNDADWEDEWDDEDSWGEDDLDPETRRQTQDRKHLVGEIREAMESVSRNSSPSRPRVTSEAAASDADVSGRKARARSQLNTFADEAEERILEKTETQMTDRETSRRRSAMAHLKAAAAATKADRVLSHVASRDPTADPEEQSPYRDDLAKVVRPHSTSRPISRQVSRPNTRSPIWDQGEGDEDAALHAAAGEGLDADSLSIEAELAAAEAERLSRAPAELSEADFGEDDGFSVPVRSKPAPEADNAFGDIDEEEFDDETDDAFGAADRFDSDDEDDDFTPRPSRVVSEAVAFARGETDDIRETPPSDMRRKIWEIAEDVATEVKRVAHDDAPEPMVEVSTAISGRAGRAGRGAGRVKTRLLGFQADGAGPRDLFAEAATQEVARTEGMAPAGPAEFPAGWIVVVDGPGRGASFTLRSGVSQIGRGEEQAVRLDFGDTSISRNNHAAVAFDDEQSKFFLGHGGKSNLVRLNGRPVLSTEEMSDGDIIRIGETTLKFIALCDESFTWASKGHDSQNA
ncbi:FHA domain-containing protein [Silicimonas algicola]|uniref:FHA domain-containing protein n=1 Tax=Silicimonas algicola TaxID=1826607 RepID=A0A316G5S2_9RHOB|nr:FHA domain-containing protein [Silicimonas algicola]PWK56208.1 FHA domain-containing protein [Silicimonas algicola]